MKSSAKASSKQPVILLHPSISEILHNAEDKPFVPMALTEEEWQMAINAAEIPDVIS